MEFLASERIQDLPKVLRKLVTDYLEAYLWYWELVERINKKGDCFILIDGIPRESMFTHIRTFYYDGHLETTACLLAYLLRYLSTSWDAGNITQYLPEKTLVPYLTTFLSAGFPEACGAIVDHYPLVFTHFLPEVIFKGTPELVEFLFLHKAKWVDWNQGYVLGEISALIESAGEWALELNFTVQPACLSKLEEIFQRLTEKSRRGACGPGEQIELYLV